MRRSHTSKWLSDDKGNGAIPQADSEWAMGTFVPQAVQAGWKFWAIIQPDQAVGEAPDEALHRRQRQGRPHRADLPQRRRGDDLVEELLSGPVRRRLKSARRWPISPSPAP